MCGIFGILGIKSDAAELRTQALESICLHKRSA